MILYAVSNTSILTSSPSIWPKFWLVSLAVRLEWTRGRIGEALQGNQRRRRPAFDSHPNNQGKTIGHSPDLDVWPSLLLKSSYAFAPARFIDSVSEQGKAGLGHNTLLHYSTRIQ